MWFEKEEREKIRKPKPATQPKPISHPAQQPTQPQTREQPNPRPLSCASPNSTSAQTGPGHFPLLSLPPTQHRGPARPVSRTASYRPFLTAAARVRPPLPLDPTRRSLARSALQPSKHPPRGPAGPTPRSVAAQLAQPSSRSSPRRPANVPSTWLTSLARKSARSPPADRPAPCVITFLSFSLSAPAHPKSQPSIPPALNGTDAQETPAALLKSHHRDPLNLISHSSTAPNPSLHRILELGAEAALRRHVLGVP